MKLTSMKFVEWTKLVQPTKNAARWIILKGGPTAEVLRATQKLINNIIQSSRAIAVHIYLQWRFFIHMTGLILLLAVAASFGFLPLDPSGSPYRWWQRWIRAANMLSWLFWDNDIRDSILERSPPTERTSANIETCSTVANSFCILLVSFLWRLAGRMAKTI